MQNFQEYAQKLTAGRGNMNAVSTFSLTADGKDILANGQFNRYEFSTEETPEWLGLATVETAGEVKATAALSKDEEGLKLQLSDGSVHRLSGELSRSQVANILSHLGGAHATDYTYCVYARKNDPAFDGLRIDDAFYAAYVKENNLKEVYHYDSDEDYETSARINPDGCAGCGGGPGRCTTFSHKCSPW